MFAAVARAGGSSLEAGGPDWLRRRTVSAPEYTNLGGTRTGSVATGTLRDYFAWAARSRRFWLLFLFPLFLILRALDPSGSRAAPSDIYTLY